MVEGIKRGSYEQREEGGQKGSEVERKEKKNKERERIHRKTREISGRNRYMYQWTTFFSPS